MKNPLSLIILAAVLSLGAVSQPNSESQTNSETQSEDSKPQAQEAFPITIDFECPRDFGFHIGDEIPLTVTLEAKEGIIVDLVNLPQKKETHGPFEVRDLKVRKRRERDRTIYRIFYRLQAFTPAIAVDTLSFPPLRISYATKEDWNSVESRYHYRSLLSQPYDIYVSRTATYFGPMKDIKGPIMDERVSLLWKVATGVGSVMVVLAFITWPLEYFRRKRRVGRQDPGLTAKDRALRALQEARENCFNYSDHRKRLFFEINAILRAFLKEVCGLDAANRPSLGMMEQLKDRPYYEELRDLVVRINQVIYEGDAPVDVEPIVRQFSGLLGRIDGGTLSGVSHDPTG